MEVVVDSLGDHAHDLSESASWEGLDHQVVSQELARGIL
jgi:hypothetical protein